MLVAIQPLAVSLEELYLGDLFLKEAVGAASFQVLLIVSFFPEKDECRYFEVKS